MVMFILKRKYKLVIQLVEKFPKTKGSFPHSQIYHQTASSASLIQHTRLHFISPYSVLPPLSRCLK